MGVALLNNHSLMVHWAIKNKCYIFGSTAQIVLPSVTQSDTSILLYHQSISVAFQYLPDTAVGPSFPPNIAWLFTGKFVLYNCKEIVRNFGFEVTL